MTFFSLSSSTLLPQRHLPSSSVRSAFVSSPTERLTAPTSESIRTQDTHKPSGSLWCHLSWASLQGRGRKVAPLSRGQLTFHQYLGSILSCLSATSASGSLCSQSLLILFWSLQMSPATKVFLNPLLPPTPVPPLSSLTLIQLFFPGTCYYLMLYYIQLITNLLPVRCTHMSVSSVLFMLYFLSLKKQWAHSGDSINMCSMKNHFLLSADKQAQLYLRTVTILTNPTPESSLPSVLLP